ncbi:uncharacterized protein LOC108906881 isoform X2 [Anoplophora glabripennis]|uniref:uncharacterized protein LOC108906881 isoform X2 n=1 Tax=Anoplophora glabripennis TaxID=217634 RepID=UPI0008747204|nr:uncharacterized protein LOC108906881 isoform X2 [Anoplophora glabripennis]
MLIVCVLVCHRDVLGLSCYLCMSDTVSECSDGVAAPSVECSEDQSCCRHVFYNEDDESDQRIEMGCCTPPSDCQDLSRSPRDITYCYHCKDDLCNL